MTGGGAGQVKDWGSRYNDGGVLLRRLGRLESP